MGVLVTFSYVTTVAALAERMLMGSMPIPGLVLLDVDTGVPDQVLLFSCRPATELSEAGKRFLQHAFDFFGIPADASSFDQFNGN